MRRILLSIASLILCLSLPLLTTAQVQMTITVTNTSISTTCDDGSIFGVPLGIEPAISVQLAGQSTYYYEDGDCPFFNATAPFLQYDESFDCPSDYPATIQVCLEAYEEDGLCATGGPDCYTSSCNNFPTPPVGGSITHTMNISGNGSTGSVTFTISSSGSFTLPGSAYDEVCNAINLGTLSSGGSLGNSGLSNYGNYCATDNNDPEPWGGDNEQGVWFQFTTGPNPSTVISFDANSDPQNLGDGIDLQLALYESSNGTCSGTLSLVEQEYQGLGAFFDEDMDVECLQPNTTYFLLVDGEDLTVLGISNGGQQGFFGLQINDQGVVQSADVICDAQSLGAVPAGGSVSTPNLSQSNICAGNAGDPNPGNWSSDQTVWFSFIAPPSGHAIINAESDLPWPIGTDAVDLQLALYESDNNTCTGNLTEVDSDYDPIIFDEELDVRCLEPGRIYYILVDGSGLNVDGIFDVTVADGGIPPAPNDEICNAIPLGQPAPGGTVGLTNQNNYCADNLFEPIPSNWGNDQGVWYTFVAPPSGKVEIRLDNLGLFSDQIDLQAAVYDAQNQACTDPLTEIASEHEGIGVLWDEDMEVECLIPGRTYYIMVDGEGSLINPDLQEGIFNIEVYGDPRDPAAPNDEPCNAIALGDPTGAPVGTSPITSHGSQNNFCATALGEPTPSGFTPNQTVWYTFTAPATGNVNIFVNSDPVIGGTDPIDVELAVWEPLGGCSGPWREIQSGDDLLGYDLDMDVNCLEPGQTYYIQLDGSDLLSLVGSDEGYFDITLTELPSFPIAPNDEICNAVALGDPFASGSVGISNQNNLCADDIGDPTPDAFGTDQTVWYTFTTPATGGPYAVDVAATTGLPWPFGSGSIDLQVAVFESSNNTCTGTLTEVESEYDPIIFDENVTVQCLQPNSTYFVMIDGSFFDQQGFFDINITPAPSVPIPTNDLICNAEPLGTVPVGGSINNNIDYFNFCADTEPGEPSPFGIDQTVWFSFEAPNHAGPNASSEVTISVEADPNGVGDLVDLQLAVYESSNGTCTGTMSLLENGSDDPTFSFDAEVSVTCLQPGQTYFVQVDGSILNLEGYFTIEIQDDGAGLFPSNDDICNATPLGTVPNGGSINNNTNYFNYCATTEPGEPNPGAFGIDETVWFSFEAPASGNVTIDAFSDPNGVGDDPNLQIALWYSPNGTCTGPFLEVDSDYDGIFFDESMSVECLIPGFTYYLQVDATDAFFGEDEGDFTLQISDDGGTTNFPYNNDICNAHNFGVPTGAFTQLSNETNVCANVQLGEPGLGSYATHTVWYQFTAPPSGLVEIEVESTDPILGMDPEVYVFSSNDNTCNGALSLNESANFPTAIFTEEIIAVCLIPGNNYFIQVDGSNLVDEGTFDIRIRDLEPTYGTGAPSDPEPPNNICSNAIPIPVQSESCGNGSGSWNMYNYGLPTPTVNPSCGQNCGETWYTFTMPASGIALVEGNDDGVGSGFPIGDFSDLHVAAYTGTCGNLTEIACDGGGLTDDVGFEVAAPPGTQVFLQVFNDGGDDNQEDFELCVSEGCGADNCLNAMAYPIQPNIPYCFNTAAATGEDVAGGTPGYYECGEGDNPENSIYYYFVSDCNGSAVTLNIINATASGGCLLGTIPDDGFNISFFQDATPCDNSPDALVDCQNFNSCMTQPINWSFTYTNLLPNTPYIIQIDGGFNFLGGDNSGFIMVQTTTNPVVLPTSTPVTCGGANDGTATATTVGGVPPFSFQWSNGSTDSIATGLAPGAYTVTVTSAGVGGCFDTATVVVGNPTNMDAVINSVTDESCANACDGTASANATGGTVITGYTYQWDAAAGNQTTQTATGLCAGTYTVTVFDNGGCSDTETVTVGSPPGITASVDATTDALCNGVCDGTATVSATGGTITTDYTYVWPTGDSTASVTGLCAGAYNVTIEDRNGCFDTVTVIINQPLSVDASIANQTDVLCNGDASGSFEILAINGTAPYQYDIGGGPQGTNIFNNLNAGSYIVTITDANGCNDTAQVDITEPTILNLQLISTLDISCNGLADGELVVNGTGGTAPLEYAIDGINFQASNTFSNLAAGNYTITVRDANNCTATIAATLNEPNAISINLDAQSTASCGLCDGTANITASGGAGGLSYQWSSGETTANATALCAGNNEVTVTDANGCTASLAVNIANSTGFAANLVVDSITCNAATDGQIAVIPTGGLAPYTFSWNTGDTNDTLFNLAAGTYSVTVDDASGCSFIANITLLDPPLLSSLAAELQPASCNGSSDAQAIATPSGGTAPYTYAWDNGETTQTAIALDAGAHTVSVTDANNCVTTANVTITEPAAFAVSIINVTSSICGSAGCDGTAQIAVSGGTAPYTYQWSNGDLTAAPTNLCSGFNDVTVTDASACTATDAVNVPSNSSLNVSLISSSNPTCFGDCDGDAIVSASGGNTAAPYIFTWDNGATTANISNLCDGIYRVTVSDIDGCSNAIAVTITEPSELVASAVVSSNYNGEDLSCVGATDGAATVNIVGGTPTYTINWDNSQSTATATGLSAGSYQVTVVDANACSDTSIVSLQDPPSLALNAVVSSNYNGEDLSCVGAADGVATATASGGTGSFTYLWSDGQTTSIATGLQAGTYTVTATDANGCETLTSVTLNDPTPVTANATAISNFNGVNVSCHGASDGEASATANGGTGAYTYLWSTGNTTTNIIGLSAGAYPVTVTDANACTVIDTAIILEPTPISNSFLSTDVSCNGGADATATAQPQGGTAPYSYNWFDGTTSDNIGGLAIGTYQLTITDANACVFVDSVSITEPTPLTASTDSTAALCQGTATGTATVSPSGATPAYSYNWSDGQTTATATNLNPGTYTVTVTDANSCTIIETITVDDVPAITQTSSVSDVLCNGGTDGTASFNASGGVGSFTYLWSDGQTTSTATGLSAGTYCVTATDANGCTIDTCLVLNEPPALTAPTFNVVDLLCATLNDGELTANTTGGTAPYTYLWSDGQTTQTAIGLGVGTYTVTITDANACQITGSATIASPPILALTLATDSVYCKNDSDGSASVLASGGVAPYSYQWSNGVTTALNDSIPAGSYAVTVTDANGCTISDNINVGEPASAVVASVLSTTDISCNAGSNGAIDADALGGTPNYTFLWSTGDTTEDLTNLSAGVYSMTATDARGCSATTSTTLTEPSALIATASQYSNYNGAAISCTGAADAAVQVNTSGGVGPYTIAWSTGANTQIADNLAPGTYYVSVTDANACVEVDSISITEPLPVQVTETHTNVSCHGACDGQIIANAVPGTGTLGIGGYEYRILGPGQLGNIFSSNNVFTGLCAGTYTVELRDGNGCTTSVMVVITEPTELSNAITVSDASCNGLADGTATALVSGGTASYSYNWSNGSTSSSATGLAAGAHSLTITDANACSLVSTFNINEPLALAATTSSDSTYCTGAANGSATVTATGGTAPYSYQWNNGDTMQTAIGLGAATYTVTVTDANACQVIETATVLEPSPISATISSVNLSCTGSASGSATVVPTGGTAPYTYLWSDGQTTATATGLAIGSYIVIVTDANGCQTNASTTITQPTPVIGTFVTSTNASCNGLADGTAMVSAAGGTTPYTYQWPDGQVGSMGVGLAAGSYIVTITDANGCTTTVVATVGQPPSVQVDSMAMSPVSCKFGNNGTATAYVSGGTMPYTYAWSNTATTQSLSNISAGTYHFTVTDANGCSDSSSIIVTEPASELVGVINMAGALCQGGASGQLTAVIGGGTLPASGDYFYNWSNGATTAVNDSLTAGTYTVTVTDANGCSLVLSETVSQAGNLSISVVSTMDASCAGGSDGMATVTASGGTGTLVYQWPNGQNTGQATGLSAGTYEVTVTDANGCFDITTVSIGEGAAVTLDANISNVSCYGESNGLINVTNSNSTIAVYQWSNGQIGNPASGLSAGAYSLTVTTVQNCDAVFNFVITQPDSLEIEIATLSGISCRDDSTGALSVTANGGSSNYSYLWSNTANTTTINNLPAGTYTVTATDANACQATATASLTNPSALTVDASAIGVACTGDNNGAIQVSASGGSTALGQYEFSLDSANWQMGNLFPNLTDGAYTVYVRDNNACVASTSLSVDAASEFFISSFTPALVGVDTTIEYGDTLEIAVELNDTNAVIFSWMDVNANTVLNDSSYVLIAQTYNATIYEFTATSAEGCVVDTSLTVRVTKTRVASAPTGFTPNSDGVNDAFFIQTDKRVTNVLVFRVYDRWGEKVFEGTDLTPNDPQQGWDGTFRGREMQSGVYAWYAEVEFIDGERVVIKGSVTLMR